MKGSSFLPLMEEKEQKKIKAAGLPANLAEASKDNPSPPEKIQNDIPT